MTSEVFNEDCMIGMARYPDGYFDLAIVDPPYGIGEHGGKKRESPIGRAKGLKSANYRNAGWDIAIPHRQYFLELIRVSRHQIIWGGNYFIDYLRATSCFIVWDKKGNDKSDFADAELAWTSFASSVRIFRYPWIGFGYLNNPHGEEKIHPTQKPVALYKWLIEKYARHGDKILDTHMGSQSSRIAAYNMGFDFYGWEIDKDYFEAGNERFMEQTAQMQLFAPETFKIV